MVCISHSIGGNRRERSSYPWVGSPVFARGQDEGDPGALQLLLPRCHSLQVNLLPLAHCSELIVGWQFYTVGHHFLLSPVSCKNDLMLRQDHCQANKGNTSFHSLFSSSMTLDSVCHKPADTEQSISRSLRKDIVNCLRRYKHSVLAVF